MDWRCKKRVRVRSRVYPYPHPPPPSRSWYHQKFWPKLWYSQNISAKSSTMNICMRYNQRYPLSSWAISEYNQVFRRIISITCTYDITILSQLTNYPHHHPIPTPHLHPTPIPTPTPAPLPPQKKGKFCEIRAYFSKVSTFFLHFLTSPTISTQSNDRNPRKCPTLSSNWLGLIYGSSE